MRNILIATAGLIALSAAMAPAQDQPAVTDRELAASDADGDGSVTQNEFMGMLDGAYKALDADANGVVTWVEAEAAMAREHFDAIDADKDGNMTADELKAQGATDFATADRDGDGTLK